MSYVAEGSRNLWFQEPWPFHGMHGKFKIRGIEVYCNGHPEDVKKGTFRIKLYKTDGWFGYVTCSARRCSPTLRAAGVRLQYISPSVVPAGRGGNMCRHVDAPPPVVPEATFPAAPQLGCCIHTPTCCLRSAVALAPSRPRLFTTAPPQPLLGILPGPYFELTVA